MAAVELGQAEIYSWGEDGMLVACGAQFGACVKAARRLRTEGLDVGVINARFIKPLDHETILRAVTQTGFVVCVEESTLLGGFGSAVLEACNAAGVSTDRIRRLGIPDRYIDHADRSEQLAELGLDVDGIVRTALAAAAERGSFVEEQESV